jgi:hypothetical protein
LRKQCNAEFTSAETTMGLLMAAANDLPRDRFRELRDKAPPMFGQLDALRGAAIRLQQCVARGYERERFASFQRECGRGCDKVRLLQEFDESAREFIDKSLSLAALADGGSAATIPRQWHVEEEGGRGAWTRRSGAQIFDATWTVANRQQTAGTVEINRIGDRVTALRTQAGGRCLYQGIIAGQSARGTYTCFWIPGAFGWQAAIGD